MRRTGCRTGIRCSASSARRGRAEADRRPGTSRNAWPRTGCERFQFISTAASSDGERLAFELTLRPGGAVPMPHVHPEQTERFEVLERQMRFRVGLRHVVAGPGEIVEIKPGILHGFANAADVDAGVRVDVTPALAMEEMFEQAVAMATAGRMNRFGMARNLLDLARLACEFEHEAHAPVIGRHLQHLFLAPLAALARSRDRRRRRRLERRATAPIAEAC